MVTNLTLVATVLLECLMGGKRENIYSRHAGQPIYNGRNKRFTGNKDGVKPKRIEQGYKRASFYWKDEKRIGEFTSSWFTY